MPVATVIKGNEAYVKVQLAQGSCQRLMLKKKKKKKKKYIERSLRGHTELTVECNGVSDA